MELPIPIRINAAIAPITAMVIVLPRARKCSGQYFQTTHLIQRRRKYIDTDKIDTTLTNALPIPSKRALESSKVRRILRFRIISMIMTKRNDIKLAATTEIVIYCCTIGLKTITSNTGSTGKTA